MEVIRDRQSARERTLALRRDGRRLGLVPTMGALHAGHLSLLQRARLGCDHVAVSIFVNPLQFGPGEDLERYPRDLDGDLARLEAAGCDVVFAPTAAEMYSAGANTFVEVPALDGVLCGRTRPGHFRGVTTVVAKLFNLMQPDVAVFGQKDAQQALLIRRMVSDLDWPIELRFAPIVRDADGLALSSRNAYLSAEERRDALLLHAALTWARAAIDAGERHVATLLEGVRGVLQRGARLRIEYTEVVDIETLRPLDAIAGVVLIAVAVFIGHTRLIDNLLLEVRGPRVEEYELTG